LAHACEDVERNDGAKDGNEMDIHQSNQGLGTSQIGGQLCSENLWIPQVSDCAELFAVGHQGNNPIAEERQAS